MMTFIQCGKFQSNLVPHTASTAEVSIVVAEMAANQISDFLLKGTKINTV